MEEKYGSKKISRVFRLIVRCDPFDTLLQVPLMLSASCVRFITSKRTFAGKLSTTKIVVIPESIVFL